MCLGVVAIVVAGVSLVLLRVRVVLLCDCGLGVGVCCGGGSVCLVL